MLLTFVVFVMDNSKYLLNLMVQEVGYFLQNSILLLNFWTDAFGQLREGEGRAVDGHASNESWMDWCTLGRFDECFLPVYLLRRHLILFLSFFLLPGVVGLLGVFCGSVCCSHLSWPHCIRGYYVQYGCTHYVLHAVVQYLGWHWSPPVPPG